MHALTHNSIICTDTLNPKTKINYAFQHNYQPLCALESPPLTDRGTSHIKAIFLKNSDHVSQSYDLQTETKGRKADWSNDGEDIIALMLVMCIKTYTLWDCIYQQFTFLGK